MFFVWWCAPRLKKKRSGSTFAIIGRMVNFTSPFQTCKKKHSGDFICKRVWRFWFWPQVNSSLAPIHQRDQMTATCYLSSWVKCPAVKSHCSCQVRVISLPVLSGQLQFMSEISCTNFEMCLGLINCIHWFHNSDIYLKNCSRAIEKHCLDYWPI